MPQPGGPTDWDDFRSALEQLEARVASLEQRVEAAPAAAPPPRPAPVTPAQAALAEGAGVIPILGRALLGLAGAYGLRALTESHALPPKTGVFAAILYAVAWLVWAARTQAGRRAETVIYSLTAALVLGPLLWESTLRLQVVSTWTAALVLLLFTGFGLLISWHKNLLIVATISTLTGVLTAAALLIGSHDVVPFTLLLLAIAAAVEACACLDHWLSERWLTAAAADLAVLLATYLVANARGLPEGYAPIPLLALLAAQSALPAIYLASTMVRTLLRGFVFTIFETAQLLLAFSLAVGGGLQLAGSDARIAPALAAVSLASAVACYTAGFRHSGRNARTYAAFGFLLAITGIRIALSAEFAAGVWSLLALAALGAKTAAWRWHGVLYLLCALFTSGALAQATSFLLGSSDSAGTVPLVAAEAAAALVCYQFAHRDGATGVLPAAVLAGAAFWLTGGVLASGLTYLYHSLLGASASHAWCGTLRTAVLALGAVLLAWAGVSWKRLEFAPLVYPVMLLGAYRVLLIDLHQDGNAALVLSLLAYGTALIFLPRWMQPRRAPQVKPVSS